MKRIENERDSIRAEIRGKQNLLDTGPPGELLNRPRSMWDRWVRSTILWFVSILMVSGAVSWFVMSLFPAFDRLTLQALETGHQRALVESATMVISSAFQDALHQGGPFLVLVLLALGASAVLLALRIDIRRPVQWESGALLTLEVCSVSVGALRPYVLGIVEPSLSSILTSFASALMLLIAVSALYLGTAHVLRLLIEEMTSHARKIRDEIRTLDKQIKRLDRHLIILAESIGEHQAVIARARVRLDGVVVDFEETEVAISCYTRGYVEWEISAFPHRAQEIGEKYERRMNAFLEEVKPKYRTVTAHS